MAAVRGQPPRYLGRLAVRRVALATLAAALACGDSSGPGHQPLLPISGFVTTTVDTAGEVGFYVAIARDKAGGLHLSYGDRTNASLKYATCLSGCGTTAAWAATTVDTGLHNWGYFAHTAIATDDGGRVHIGYYGYDGGNRIKYATCNTGCTTPASWQTVIVDTAGVNPDFVVSGGGQIHGAWFNRSTDAVVYATCTASCASPANWRRVVIDSGGVSQWLSLALDAAGRVHLAYSTSFSSVLRYARCASNCPQSSSWTLTNLPWNGTAFVREMQIVVDGGGGLHIGYDDWGARTRYLFCGSSCTDPGRWQTTPVDTTWRRVGWATAVTPGGHPRISYYELNTEDLLLGLCNSSVCSNADGWQRLAVDTLGDVGAYSALLLDTFGRPTIAYLDRGNSDLKIAVPF